MGLHGGLDVLAASIHHAFLFRLKPCKLFMVAVAFCDVHLSVAQP